ncbi:MAG: hypothetical protein IJM62_00130 [Lachnospiraceae bacterium]|nr:hypothetical protein [Lachnospiraceae bacterium]
MRNSDDQLREILKRSNIIKKKSELKYRIVTDAVSVCACIAVCIAAAVMMSVRGEAVPGAAAQHYGALVLKSSYMGYVVIGTAALFALLLFVLIFMHYRDIKKLDGIKK